MVKWVIDCLQMLTCTKNHDLKKPLPRQIVPSTPYAIAASVHASPVCSFFASHPEPTFHLLLFISKMFFRAEPQKVLGLFFIVQPLVRLAMQQPWYHSIIMFPCSYPLSHEPVTTAVGECERVIVGTARYPQELPFSKKSRSIPLLVSWTDISTRRVKYLKT